MTAVINSSMHNDNEFKEKEMNTWLWGSKIFKALIVINLHRLVSFQCYTYILKKASEDYMYELS